MGEVDLRQTVFDLLELKRDVRIDSICPIAFSPLHVNFGLILVKSIEGLEEPDWIYDLFELAKNGSIENSVNAIDLVFDSGWSSSIELCDRDADLLEMHA